ncbi:hypothetical protein PBI_LUCKY3_22 [Microbacterium phage Lucky3]|uniref:Minor tail protein n=1 Tax=Microbacterium phage Lucky3 TaxID=2099626 RepID=A0A2P1CFX3_9CAUD|nr:hypothetical protein PBI_LUCKY3_22 [Microbacterium phage Lucky3]
MPLENPDAPAYGPNTFTVLAAALQTLFENDEYLEDLIDNLNPTPSVSKAAVSLASGYSNRSGYITPTAIKIASLATLEGGVLDCPASFTGNTYYTWGTLPSGYEPTDGLHRLANGTVWTSGGIIPAQFRINENGALQGVFQANVTGASYLIIPSGMGWESA